MDGAAVSQSDLRVLTFFECELAAHMDKLRNGQGDKASGAQHLSIKIKRDIRCAGAGRDSHGTAGQQEAPRGFQEIPSIHL